MISGVVRRESGTARGGGCWIQWRRGAGHRVCARLLRGWPPGGISPATCGGTSRRDQRAGDRGRGSAARRGPAAVKMAGTTSSSTGCTCPRTFGRKQEASGPRSGKHSGTAERADRLLPGRLRRAATPARGTGTHAAREAGIAAISPPCRGLAGLGYLGWDEAGSPAAAAGEGDDGGARAATAAGPAPLRRRARQRPAEYGVLPASCAAAGALHRRGGRPALHT